MDLIIHVTVAFASLAFTTYACLMPSAGRLKFSYFLIAATLVTGTYLVFMHPGHILQACVSGLVYVSVMTAATALVKRRLVQVSI